MITIRNFITGAILLATLAGTSAATYTLQLGNITWTGSAGGYHCFTATAYPNTVNFTITKVGNGAASYAVTAGTSLNTGTYTRKLKSGGNLLNYQLFTTSAMSYQLKAPTTATVNEVISGSLTGGGQVLPLSFIFYIAPGQVVPPGTYTDQVTVSVYQAYNSTGTPYTSKTITITAVVTADAAISIVPTGNPFNSSSPNLTLSFGTLSSGLIRSCDILIKQNNNCTVFFGSDNNSVLKQVPATADQISYTASSSGTPINLTQPGSTPLPSGMSVGPDGNRYPLSITIGTVGAVGAGTYQDRITFTVVAQ